MNVQKISGALHYVLENFKFSHALKGGHIIILTPSLGQHEH
jgi:hypothetical protein